ncbi:unnamed protein product [Rhizophagus irregularis]|nr:unnamed protein product [Rhizophagus irregularis]
MSHPGLLLISTVIPIPEHIEVGKLIGREGRNLKPISAKTGTFVSVNTNTNPAQIEIKYQKEITVKKEKQRSKKKISTTIKSYMEGGLKEGWEMEWKIDKLLTYLTY